MALDTFNPYLFVSAGEQSNKFLTPTYADGIAQFQAQRAQEISGLTVQFGPIQEGTGDPSPENIRPISGRTGLTVTRAGKNLWSRSATYTTTDVGYMEQNAPLALKAGTYMLSYKTTVTTGEIVFAFKDAANVNVASVTILDSVHQSVVTLPQDSEKVSIFSNRAQTISEVMIEMGTAKTAYTPYVAPATYPVSWQTEAGTVYGGTLDVVSGVLTVDWDYIASYNGETLPGEWISDRDVYAEGTTPTTGAEVAYKLAEPVTYQLDPEQVMTAPGFNQVYSDAGPVIDIQF